jgi:hypothetical protein
MENTTGAYLRWVDEEVETPAGARTARVAWLVCDEAPTESSKSSESTESLESPESSQSPESSPDAAEADGRDRQGGTEPDGAADETRPATGVRYLAYLGQRPAITPQLIEELSALYPELTFDWGALRREVAQQPGHIDVARLTDDDLAQNLGALAAQHGLSLTDLSLRLGYGQRTLLPELLRYLDDPVAVARFERTSGSIFDYLVERHPQYAFLLFKARLLFSGQEETLRQLIAAESAGFGQLAARERRAFWREQLAAYQAGKRL